MVNLGLPIGHPKLVFKDGCTEYVNNVVESEEEWLIALEMKDTDLKQIWHFIEGDLCRDGDADVIINSPHSGPKTLCRWLPYTIGATLDHPKLVSPERLLLPQQLDQSKEVTRMGLARMFHQLYVFLPINSIDEMKHRLQKLFETSYPYKNNWMPTVAEVT